MPLQHLALPGSATAGQCGGATRFQIGRQLYKLLMEVTLRRVAKNESDRTRLPSGRHVLSGKGIDQCATQLLGERYEWHDNQ